jgi:hypothetical protein
MQDQMTPNDVLDSVKGTRDALSVVVREPTRTMRAAAGSGPASGCG